MTRFLLVRHGETDWNRQRRFQGHADPPLNDEGFEQSRAIAREVAEWQPNAVYTSDLRRARETGEIVADVCGVPLTATAELREVDVGEWQGLTWPEIEERYPDGSRLWEERGHGWERGESYDAFQARVLAALRRIAARHPDGRLAVIAHGGTLRAVSAHVDGAPVAEHRRQSSPIGNCETVQIAIRDGTFRRLD